MNIKTLLHLAFGLSALALSYTTHAKPLGRHHATVIADCTDLDTCPLTRGDIISNNSHTHSGLPFSNGILFFGVNTDAKILNLNTHTKAFYLIEGTLSLRIFENRRDTFEIKAGDLTLAMQRAGYYKIKVSPNGQTTDIQVVDGQATIYSGNLASVIRKGETFRYLDNLAPRYRKIILPLYDDQYYFNHNFMNGYFRQYPLKAPKIRVAPHHSRGPQIEIITAPHPFILEKHSRRPSDKPVIIRDPRHRNNAPVLREHAEEQRPNRARPMPRPMPRQEAPNPEPIGPQSSLLKHTRLAALSIPDPRAVLPAEGADLEPTLIEQQKQEQIERDREKIRENVERKQERIDPSNAVQQKVEREEMKGRKVYNPKTDAQTLEMNNIREQRKGY